MIPKKYQLAYEKAVDLLYDCSTRYGFKAAKSKTSNGNYERIWARDSMICSIAAFSTEDFKLISTARKSLQTLIKYQHEQGEIPSNVDPLNEKVSFGGTAGRVDSNLWFLIGFGQYVKKTKDINFAKRYFYNYRKCMRLLRVYEFNHKGFIYVPLTGDWADEYIQEGYVLYDQILYYQAFKEYNYIKNLLNKKSKRESLGKPEKIKKNIQINFWPVKKNMNESYNSIIFKKALKSSKPYFKPHFNPAGYGEHFDLFANSLSILAGISNQKQKKSIIEYVKKNFNSTIPAFYPVITKSNPLWKVLKNNYGLKFRNKPHEYHNGGAWPMVLGFYCSATKNKKILNLINQLNEKNNWEFNEVFNGKTEKPIGTKYQSWSASATILATQVCFNNKEVFN